MSDDAYTLVREKLESQGLRVVGIVAPLRTSSTALEICLTQSPSVIGQINQPFHLMKGESCGTLKDREQKAYSEILRRLNELSPKKSEGREFIVIKEMTKNLLDARQIERWRRLLDVEIVLLRNPVLAVESLLQRYLVSINERTICRDIDLNEYSREFFSCATGSSGWDQLRSTVISSHDYTSLAKVLKAAFLESDHNAGDAFAQNATRGWRDYFSTSNTGWTALERYLRQSKEHKNRIFVDASMLRARPSILFPELCVACEIEYTYQVHKEWTRFPRNTFDFGHYRSENPYFSNVMDSVGLKEPAERPISIDRFPDFVSKHLTTEALPLYFDCAARYRDEFVGRDVAHTMRDQVIDGQRFADIDPICCAFSDVLGSSSRLASSMEGPKRASGIALQAISSALLTSTSNLRARQNPQIDS